MPNPIPLTDQIAFLQRLTVRWAMRERLPGLPDSIHELACLRAAIALLEELIADEADGPWPDIIDQCPCADCTTPLLWTRLNDVRTAWAVHQCPPREELKP